jgi:hypothetical protein
MYYCLTFKKHKKMNGTVEFIETKSALDFMKSIGATNLNIQQGDKKIPYIGFNNSSKTTAMLSSKVTAVTAHNIHQLQVSWVEGTNENGKAVKGYLLHRAGTPAEVLSTFSVADMATI